MLDWFRLPTDFNHQVILSQILQAMAMKYAVEHWRCNMPRSMGALYWQLNDCWPVASWASIDCYGRWKALHHMARRFFEPVHITGIEDWETGTVEIHITNDTQEQVSGTVHWQLLTAEEGTEISRGLIPVKVDGVSSLKADTLEFQEQLANYGKDNLILFFWLDIGGHTASDNLVIFCQPKKLRLQNPELKFELRDRELVVMSDKPALWVWVDVDSDEPLASNFFHVLPNHEHGIELSTVVNADEFVEKMKLYSLWHTYSKK
jgi:beta-mannosidase